MPPGGNMTVGMLPAFIKPEGCELRGHDNRPNRGRRVSRNTARARKTTKSCQKSATEHGCPIGAWYAGLSTGSGTGEKDGRAGWRGVWPAGEGSGGRRNPVSWTGRGRSRHRCRSKLSLRSSRWRCRSRKNRPGEAPRGGRLQCTGRGYRC